MSRIIDDVLYEKICADYQKMSRVYDESLAILRAVGDIITTVESAPLDDLRMLLRSRIAQLTSFLAERAARTPE